MFSFRVVSVTPKLPELISRLRELAYDFWFSWNPSALELFRLINPELWHEVGHNPVKFLMRIDEEALEAVAQDEDFLVLYRRVIDLYDRYSSEDTWFSRTFPSHRKDTIAYFSAEFGLHESHPIYSGGLGLLAGDHCKSASELGLPFIGVGLLYKHGYFYQKISGEGRQIAEYPHFNFFEMPIMPVNNPDGSQLTVMVELPGRQVYVQVWRVKVGRITIYLLDSDNPKNISEDRHLTGQLYGGDRQYRISQEILLGVGGVRALRAIGINPRAWHINEGHAAFLIVERIRELMRFGISFDTAREVVRSNTIFTTHTPVPAGHDLFPEDMIGNYLIPIITEMCVNFKTFKDLGWDEDRNSFNMTLLALRHSFLSNGVSRLHGKVARDMFRDYYGRLHPEEIPITSITNGVHTDSWLAPDLKDLFNRYLGRGWTDQLSNRQLWDKLDQAPDQDLWKIHRSLKETLIEFVRFNLKQQRMRNREPLQRILEIDEYLSPDHLIIGFARRFATYKRATLLFRDLDRLNRLVNNPERPVRFVFAGKAHPADLAGQELIRHVYEISMREEFRGKIILLENYDIHMSRHLVQGADVWLNTPRRPLEASGTSGQKAGLNGVINASTLDGWWPEGYNGKNGYAIGTENTYSDDELQDRDDCYSLYSILEEKLIPAYYRKEGGLPVEWIKMMKESIKSIAPVFNTSRMVEEYTRSFYIPAIERGAVFTARNNEIATRASVFKKFIVDHWKEVAFISIETDGKPRMRAGEILSISAEVRLGPIYPKSVVVELVSGEVDDEGIKNVSFTPMLMEKETSHSVYRFTGQFMLPQGARGYTVRVRPYSKNFPYTELPLITWAEGF